MSVVQNKKYRDRQKRKDALISFFIGVFAFIWLVPILWTFWTSLRPYEDIIQKGVFSRPDTLNLANYVDAYRQMEIWGYLSNSFLVAIPAVILTLFFGSLLAFVVTRYSFRFNLYLLLLFTAGNLLPVQLVYAPLFKMYIWFGDLVGNRNILYDSYIGLILIHVALQVGFCDLRDVLIHEDHPKGDLRICSRRWRFGLSSLLERHPPAPSSTTRGVERLDDHLDL